MAIDRIVGKYVGDGRQAIIVVQGNEKKYTEWSVECLRTNQWRRHTLVIPVVEALKLNRISTELLAELPQYSGEDIPANFFEPQGEITAPMFQIYDRNLYHNVLVVTRKVNYKEACKFAREAYAWYTRGSAKGLLAQLPGDAAPSFYTWGEFEEALNARFRVEPLDVTSGGDGNYTGMSFGE